MIYDLSPPLGPDIAVWPGDVPLTRAVSADLADGDRTTLSSFSATCHLGAHVDAPSHYGLEGQTIDQQPLELFIGRCQVVHVHPPRRGRVIADIIDRPISESRILFATGTYPDPNRFNDDFAGLAPGLIDELHGRGVRLIGIDTPSIDPDGDESLASHQRCLVHDIAILEGLYLADVPEGVYELIALPLRLVGFDASPVRAILRLLPGSD